MEGLRQIENKELLNELQTRIKENKISEEEIKKILRKEAWERAFLLMNKDKERNQEIAEWDRITSEDYQIWAKE